MSVSQILVILLRRAWIVVLTLLTTVIVAGGVLLFVPGRYDAVATASIDPGNIDPLSDMGGGLGRNRADTRQHPFARRQPAGGGRRRQAVEFDRQSGGAAEFPKVAFLRPRKHRGMDGRWPGEECRSEVHHGNQRPGDQIQVGRPEPGGVDRQCVSRGDDRRLGGHEGRRGRPDRAVVCSATRRIAQGAGGRARGASGLPSQDEYGCALGRRAATGRPASTWRSPRSCRAPELG